MIDGWTALSAYVPPKGVKVANELLDKVHVYDVPLHGADDLAVGHEDRRHAGPSGQRHPRRSPAHRLARRRAALR